jgi:hypothetical protein
MTRAYSQLVVIASLILIIVYFSNYIVLKATIKNSAGNLNIHPVHPIAAATTSSTSNSCLNLDFDGNLDTIVSRSAQVFITMPAKSAGTSLKTFVRKCVKPQMPDNHINYYKLVRQAGVHRLLRITINNSITFIF